MGKKDTEQVITGTVSEVWEARQGELSLNESVEVSQLRSTEEAFHGLKAASASKLMLNLFGKNTYDPVGAFGVCVSLECDNKSGRCRTQGRNAWHILIPKALRSCFGSVRSIL